MRILLKPTVKIKIDNKQWKKMERNLLRGGDKVVDVGWWNSSHVSGVPTAQVMQWNEEGHVNGGMFAGTYTPPRPFMRVGFAGEIKKIVPKYNNYVNSIAMGTMTWVGMRNKLSKELVDALKATILSWNSPSNSPATVALKGFNDPLIETGNSYDAIKSRIVQRGSK